MNNNKSINESFLKETKDHSSSINGLNGSQQVNSTRIISKMVMNIITLAYQNEIFAMREEFNKNPELNLYEIMDKRDYTLLHISALNSQRDLFIFLLELLNKRKRLEDYSDNERHQLKEWVDKRNDEGFAAIHFSAFRGNLYLIEELEKLGADMTILNKQGLGVMHIASQGDQPISLAFFKSKGLPLDSLDKKGSTPLHWAAYLGCENSVNYLTSWGAEINIADKDGGLSPLHLAVISGNTRIVRKLLIRGANRKMRDNQNKLALDLALENEFMNIHKMIDVKCEVSELCNIRPSFKPAKRKKRSLAAFITLTLVGTFLLYFFVYPYVSDVGWLLSMIIFLLLTYVFFLFSWLKDPGYLFKNSKTELLDLLRKNECTAVCPDCEILKPPRSKHCEICNRCVKVYDHHCPWINNCVGTGNHKYFLCFVIFLWIYLLECLVFIFYHLFVEDTQCTFITCWKQRSDYYRVSKITISSILILLIGVFFFPLSLLVGVHVKNFFLNKTTSERYGYQAKSVSRTSSNEVSVAGIEVNVERKSSQARRLRDVTHFSQYFKNCYAMCVTNSRSSRYEFIHDEDGNSLNNFS